MMYHPIGILRGFTDIHIITYHFVCKLMWCLTFQKSNANWTLKNYMQCKFLSFLLIKKFFLGVLGIRDKSTLLPDSDIHHHSQFRCHTSHILTLPVHCVSPPSQSLTRITTTTGMFEQTMFVWMCSVFRLRLESSEREMIHSNGV